MKKSIIKCLLITASVFCLNFCLIPLTSAQTLPPKRMANENYVVQYFNYHGLVIKFVYADNDLKAIKITNKSSTPMQLDLVNNSYVLGENDSVAYDLPNIEYVDIAVTPYVEMSTWADKTLPNRFNDVAMFHLPVQKNSTVGEIPGTTR